MKRFTISAALLGFLGFTLLLARPALTDQPSEKDPTTPASLEQLQKERIETLEKVVNILLQQSKLTATFTDVCKAKNELVEAKLDATDKPDERIALLKEQLKIAHEVLTATEKDYHVGYKSTTEADVLRAKAHCLAIEIKLLKERDKAKSAK